VTSIEFRAPWSKELRAATAVSLGVLIVVMAAAILSRSRAPLLASVLLIALPLLISVATFASRVRGYLLDEDSITVQRGGWNTRLPLIGLRSVTGDAEAMRGSIRVFGNGGLFAYTGEFWNRKLGRYRALATDPSRAIVLRYPKRTIVITPHDPQHFIMRARTFLKVADFPK
jgi:hypothetical protein